MSNNQAVAQGDVGSKASNSALNVVYENNDRSDNAASNLMSRHLYSVVMNKVDKDTLYDMRHIFDGQVFTYKAKFISGARTNLPNGRVIMTLNWIEADE